MITTATRHLNGEHNRWCQLRKGDVTYCQWLDQTIDEFYADGSAQKSWDAYLGKYSQLPIPCGPSLA